MARLRPCLLFLILLLVAAPFPGVSQGEDNYTVQEFSTSTTDNSIKFFQGISGWYVNLNESGTVSVGFNNVTLNGIYNLSAGMGSIRNQGSLAFVTIQPDQVVPAATLQGFSYSGNNRVIVNDYNYSVSLSLNNFKGSGILLLNLMAGSFSNQFTSVNFSMGKNNTPKPSPAIFTAQSGNPTVASLTNDQMEAIAATQNNDFKFLGKQQASASVEGNPQINGVCVITLSAGVNNLVSHNVRVNFNTGQ
jgi:hypothetical protein